MSATVPTIAARAVLEACAELGTDPQSVRERAGLGRVDLDDPEARIAFEVEQAVWSAALQATAEPTLPLRAAQHVRGEDYRVLVWLGRNSPTVGDALARVARWFGLVNHDVRFVVETGGTSRALVFEVPSVPGPLPRPMVDYTLAVTFLRMRDATGGALSLSRVDVPYPAPRDDLGPAVFDCPVHHATPRAALVLTRAQWERPVPGADEGLSRILEEHAAMLLERLPTQTGWLDEVERVVATALPDGAPSVATAARALGLSGRTLQRRLGEHEQTWSGLVDRVRLRLARIHLADPSMSVAEVAFLLGFSEHSAFTRAYKRWTGQTPTRARRSEDES